MQTELTLLLFILVPSLAAGVLLLWSNRPPAQFRMMQLWLALNAGVGLTAAWLVADTALQTATPRVSPGIVSFVHQWAILNIDRLTIGWSLLSGLLVLLLIHCPSPQTAPRQAFREAAIGLGLFSVSALAIFADGAWLQWGGSMAVGWLLFTLLARHTEEELKTTHAASFLTWFTLADFLGAFGLLLLGQIWSNPRLSVISNWEQLKELAPEQISIAVVGQMFVLLSLLIRSGLAPFMVWTRSVSPNTRDAIWGILFGPGLACLLFLRWGTMFNAFAEIHLLMIGLGLLSSLMLGLMAAIGTHGQRRLYLVVGAQIGYVWMGQAATAGTPGPLPLLVILSVLLLVSLLALGMERLAFEPSRRSKFPISLTLIAILLCSGLAGQEQLAEVIWKAEFQGGLSPAIRLAGVLIGHLLFSFAVFRELSRPAPTFRDHPGNVVIDVDPAAAPMSRLTWIGLGSLSVLTLVGIWGVVLFWPPAESFRPVVPLFLPIVMLIGFVGAALWPDPVEKSTFRVVPLSRLASHDFYLPYVVALFVKFPAWWISLLFRFLEQFVWSFFLIWFPSELSRKVANAAQIVDEEATERHSTGHLIGAALIMMAGVVLSRWL